MIDIRAARETRSNVSVILASICVGGMPEKNVAATTTGCRSQEEVDSHGVDVGRADKQDHEQEHEDEEGIAQSESLCREILLACVHMDPHGVARADVLTRVLRNGHAQAQQVALREFYDGKRLHLGVAPAWISAPVSAYRQSA